MTLLFHWSEVGLEVINYWWRKGATSLVNDDMFKIDEVGTDE
jgi:hypothetical protein